MAKSVRETLGAMEWISRTDGMVRFRVFPCWKWVFSISRYKKKSKTTKRNSNSKWRMRYCLDVCVQESDAQTIRYRHSVRCVISSFQVWPSPNFRSTTPTATTTLTSPLLWVGAWWPAYLVLRSGNLPVLNKCSMHCRERNWTSCCSYMKVHNSTSIHKFLAGFDTGMRIENPDVTLTCTSQGCPDAYNYPTDDTKTHGTRTGQWFNVVFCPWSVDSPNPNTAVIIYLIYIRNKASFKRLFTEIQCNNVSIHKLAKSNMNFPW